MLFGFVRTNSKEYTPADETRWGDTALSLLEEALQLLREVKVDRNEITRARWLPRVPPCSTATTARTRS